MSRTRRERARIMRDYYDDRLLKRLARTVRNDQTRTLDWLADWGSGLHKDPVAYKGRSDRKWRGFCVRVPPGWHL